jgi:phosphocarrier protein
VEIRREVEVRNKQGLHARPCHSIVSTALGYKSDLRLRSGVREVNGKSILELMTLNAGLGTKLEVRAWGGDAEALVQAIEQLFTLGFGEELAAG